MLNDQQRLQAQNIMLALGTLILLICAALPLLRIIHPATRWVYAFGAVLCLAARLTERYRGNNIRIRRLFRMAKISALLYCASAAMLFTDLLPTPPAGDWSRNWLALLMAGAIMQLYTTWAIGRETAKGQK